MGEVGAPWLSWHSWGLAKAWEKGSRGALAVTKSPQLLDTAPLVILLVRLPHNVMASVSLCFPRQKRERGGGVGGERFLHYSDQSGVESRPQQKDSTGKDPVHSIQPHMSELARLTVFQVDLIVLS